MLRATKGDADDIETSLLSQVVAEQQLGILEEEVKKQVEIAQLPSSPLASNEVKRKEMKWEAQQHREVTDKETRTTTAAEEIHIERQQEEGRKQGEDKISESKEVVTVEVQDNSVTTNEKQQQEQSPTGAPTVLFKQLKQQYQSISEKLKEHEERELARRTTLESRKKDAAQLREARQAQRKTELVTSNNHNVEEDKTNKEIVIQLDEMGSYTAFNDDHHGDVTVTTHKRHSQSIKSSVGDDEYYQHMTNNNSANIASKAT